MGATFAPDTLDSRVFVISGAARGLGASHAAGVVAAGGRVVLGDIDADGVAQVAADLGAAARAVPLDVTEEDDWRLIAEAASDFGDVAGLVNNAGIFGVGGTLDTELTDFARVQDINVTGTLLGIRALAPLIAGRGGGSIVNVSSVAGLIGIADRVAYVTSKWAVRGLTHAAAIDLGPDRIRVNSIHPGRIRTPLIAGLDSEVLPNQIIREPGLPHDITELVVFLLSDAARFSTGSEFIADGGRFVGEYVA